jgi:hypothetical protein
MPTALLEAIDAAIAALDVGETDVVRARLNALAEAVLTKWQVTDEHAL